VRIVWVCRSRGVLVGIDGILVGIVVGIYYAIVVGRREVCGSKQGVLDIDGVLEVVYVIVVGNAGVLRRIGGHTMVVDCHGVCGSKGVLDFGGVLGIVYVIVVLEGVYMIVVGSAGALQRRIWDAVGGILVVESGVLVRRWWNSW
jgi:hypothetical protein